MRELSHCCPSPSHNEEQVTVATRKFKLPRIEYKKLEETFEIGFLFWIVLKKIDEDTNIALEDKFRYLLIVILSDTRTRDLVDSYPPTADIYCKVVARLKSRFGRAGLLIEVYVNELLK